MATKVKTSNSKSTSTKANPQTMEELLAVSGVKLRGLHRGDVVEGIVTSITSRGLSLEIGAKTEAMVVDKEFAAARAYIKTLSIGDKIEAVVGVPENDAGQILVQLRKAADSYNWNKIKEWKDTDSIVRVKVLEINRGGAVVAVMDEINGFIPSSQFSQDLQERMDEVMGKEIEAKIMDYDRDDQKIILSERSVSEAEDMEKRKRIVDLLGEKSTYTGIVTRIVPFGIFVKLIIDPKKLKEAKAEETELEGLVHISEISWEKVNDPTEVAKLGDTIDVKIISTESHVGKLSLSIKQLTPDPWSEIMEKYPVDKHVSGVVVRVAPFGVFVELERGIEGLIHVSKLSTDKEFVPGEKVDCYIESIDLEGRRISLGVVLTAIPVGYK